MHELSIVMSIVEIAEEQVKMNHAKGVESIALEIGTLSGVDEHALEFAWELGVKNTVLENTSYTIKTIKGWAKCSDCDCEFEMKELYDPCPICGEYLVHIMRGKEMKVQSIVLLN